MAVLLAEAGDAKASPRTQKGPLPRLDDDGATSSHAVIISSIFIGLLAAAVLVGGHAAIDPLLRSTLAARDAGARGDVVVTMPDGRFCRHLSFDNATADIVERTVEPCKGDITRGNAVPSAPRGFAWGQRQ
jgi:hypothetical protein